ncbi:hypothetical protein [Streptomyces sp. SID3343]|uniref:hypothetical protein n=1 Tax=Streptomyces sp. SID3343 TaxID=2690260 RepID=UPI00136C775C|nr:hypothetical protein [Streptomyces sp. SID3343]MYW03489.1 hypothetical protein [Streptomyces sp. SID3343]
MALDELVDRAPTYLVDDPDPTCWMCQPDTHDTYDGQCCWRCELRLDAYANTPIEYWPTQGDHR